MNDLRLWRASVGYTARQISRQARVGGSRVGSMGIAAIVLGIVADSQRYAFHAQSCGSPLRRPGLVLRWRGRQRRHDDFPRTQLAVTSGEEENGGKVQFEPKQATRGRWPTLFGLARRQGRQHGSARRARGVGPGGLLKDRRPPASWKADRDR